MSDKLKAIEGLVRSDPLNENFSYLDSEIGYAAGYISGDTQLNYNSKGVLTSVSTPMSIINLTYDSAGVLTNVREVFDHREVGINLIYDGNGVLERVEKEVTMK